MIAVSTSTLSNKGHPPGGSVTFFRSPVLKALLFNGSAQAIPAAKQVHEPGRLLAHYNEALNKRKEQTLIAKGGTEGDAF